MTKRCPLCDDEVHPHPHCPVDLLERLHRFTLKTPLMRNLFLLGAGSSGSFKKLEEYYQSLGGEELEELQSFAVMAENIFREIRSAMNATIRKKQMTNLTAGQPAGSVQPRVNISKSMEEETRMVPRGAIPAPITGKSPAPLYSDGGTLQAQQKAWEEETRRAMEHDPFRTPQQAKEETGSEALRTARQARECMPK